MNLEDIIGNMLSHQQLANQNKETMKAIIEIFLGEIKNNVSKGEKICLMNFGQFETRFRKAKRRNSFGKQIIEIPEHYSPAFKPSVNFKNLVFVRKNG